eukprot:4919000-Prymnesium_polylepis.1
MDHPAGAAHLHVDTKVGQRPPLVGAWVVALGTRELRRPLKATGDVQHAIRRKRPLRRGVARARTHAHTRGVDGRGSTSPWRGEASGGGEASRVGEASGGLARHPGGWRGEAAAYSKVVAARVHRRDRVPLARARVPLDDSRAVCRAVVGAAGDIEAVVRANAAAEAGWGTVRRKQGGSPVQGAAARRG